MIMMPAVLDMFLLCQARLPSQVNRAVAKRYKSNSLQLIKKEHCGFEQTKRHLWFTRRELQIGQNSHQFSLLAAACCPSDGGVVAGEQMVALLMRRLVRENGSTDKFPGYQQIALLEAP
jgi:hypothetical protein